ncbi:hypothetical protein VPH35_103485 [Triticum aestivum]
MQAAASYRGAAAHRRAGHPYRRPPGPSLLLPVRVAGVGRLCDAAVPLRFGPLPLHRARGGGGGVFAHLDASNGEAWQMTRALGLILADHQKTAHASLLKTAVLSTMSMLIMPLEASAETCQPTSSFANMPIFIAVALIGAAVGGLLARQRKDELKRLNNQLRQINTALRRQAQIESFAPGLTYAPVGRAGEIEVIVDPRKQQLVVNLKNGKNYMRNQDLDKAVVEFKTALELAESIGDRFEEKKAARGLEIRCPWKTLPFLCPL